jgi:hypothetical protein
MGLSKEGRHRPSKASAPTLTRNALENHLRSRELSLAKAAAVRDREVDGIAEFALLEFRTDDRDEVARLSRPYDFVKCNGSDTVATCLCN